MKVKEILIKDLPLEERPRERLVKHGPSALANAELLAIILRTGAKHQSVLNLAKSILKKTEGIKHLNDISMHELTEIPGIGQSKAVQILASIELGKRVSQALTLGENNVPTVATPEDCFLLLGDEMKYLKQEHFVVLSLDIKQKLIAKDTVFIGALNASLVHPREVFRTALKRMASFIICIHNHPSGDITPSEQDIIITKQLVESSLIIGIPILDHVIIGRNDYSSLKAYGHM